MGLVAIPNTSPYPLHTYRIIDHGSINSPESLKKGMKLSNKVMFD